MSIGKNAEFCDQREATFGFLKIRRTSYPNQTCMFQLLSLIHILGELAGDRKPVLRVQGRGLGVAR